jgi:hypothetical protein
LIIIKPAVVVEYKDHFKILKFNLNFLFSSSENQSINNSAQINKSPTIILAIDLIEKAEPKISSKFSEANFPKCTAMASLMNLPTKKAGTMYIGFNRDIPAAKNKGVVGNGNKEYVRIKS